MDFLIGIAIGIFVGGPLLFLFKLSCDKGYRVTLSKLQEDLEQVTKT